MTTTTNTTTTTTNTTTTLFLGYSNSCDDIASSLTIFFTPTHYFSTGTESGIGIAFSLICSWIGTDFALKGNTTQRAVPHSLMCFGCSSTSNYLQNKNIS
nr:uncharacterized protein LOC101492183 isoform X3 [Cicer arietinum]